MKTRVLLSAYQCGRGMGSVSQIGWEWYSRLASRTPVTLVTHIRNRPALAAAGAPLTNSEVHYIDTEWFAKPLYRFASRLFPKSQHATFLLSSLDFFVYDREAIRLLKTLSPTRRWDIVHAVTPVSPSSATRLHELGVPLVLGPWNGGLASPSTFPDVMQEDSGWIYRIRDLGRYLDRFFRTTDSAAAILTATRATDESIPHRNRSRCIRMLENGVNLEVFYPGNRMPSPSASQPLQIVFVGRLLPFKGVAMLIEALRRLSSEFPVHLRVIGEGPLRKELEQAACRAGLTDCVQFCGALPLEEVAAEMRRAHVFCLPSVRESGGAVVLEAMACGLPTLAVRHGGPAEIVDESCGHSLTAAGPEALIADIANTLRDVAKNPCEWMKRGAVGRERSEQFYTWDAKIDTALTLYRRLAKNQVSISRSEEVSLAR